MILALSVLGIVIAYAVIGGIVYEALKYFDVMDGAEEIVAGIWPLFSIFAVVIGAAALLALGGRRVGRWIVKRAVGGGLQRIPRAIARRKK